MLHITKQTSFLALKGLGAMAIALCSVACGGRSTGELSGKVVLNNSPLPGGSLVFDYGGGVTQTVSIASTGTFSEPKLLAGTAKVGIIPPSAPSKMNEAIQAKMKAPKGVQGKDDYFGNTKSVKVPDKFKDPNTSGFSTEVKPGKNPDVTFEIKKSRFLLSVKYCGYPSYWG